MIGAYRCAEGWCESASSWDVRGLVCAGVFGLVAWWGVRRAG